MVCQAAQGMEDVRRDNGNRLRSSVLRPCDRNRRRSPGGGAVAQLTVVVIAPAIASARGRDTAAMGAARAKLGQDKGPCQSLRGVVIADCTVAQTPLHVGAPAVALPPDRQAAGIHSGGTYVL